MVDVELGTFLAFLSVPVLSVVFMSKVRSWGLIGYLFFLAIGALSFIMLGGLTLMMAGDYDVVWTQAHAAYNSTEYERNATGGLIGSIETEMPERTERTPIITEYQNIWSYVFGAFVVVFGLSYFYVMVRGGTS